MGKLTTADIQQILATEPRYLKLLREQYDSADWKSANKLQRDAINPKKWTRKIKYLVGSKTDKMGSDAGGGLMLCETPSLAGGIVREFLLKDTDHVMLLVEKDGKIVYVEDMSD